MTKNPAFFKEFPMLFNICFDIMTILGGLSLAFYFRKNVLHKNIFTHLE